MKGKQKRGTDPGTYPDSVRERLLGFRLETPSWGYADTGTRFGKYTQASAARTIEQKIQDAAEVHRLTGIAPRMAVHVLWDFPRGFDDAVVRIAQQHGLSIGSINPNLFQDQAYKLGSLANPDASIRKKAVRHCLDAIEIGRRTGGDTLSLWLADGTNYPGQDDIVRRKHRLADSLAQVHAALPESMTMLVEYKPFEPAFYHTDIPDWGTAASLCRATGPRAKVLVDTGHHLPGTNVEQIVALLLDEKMLGGFHFNDRKYADDDLTAGSIHPYQLFLIFDQIAAAQERGEAPSIATMIDQSHNLKPKVEAVVQTVVRIQEYYAKALLVDRERLAAAQGRSDIVEAEECLRAAFSLDVSPFLAQIREAMGAPADPLAALRKSDYVARRAAERGSGQAETSSFA